MVPDYHIHTRLCGHASGDVEELVAAAVSAGFAEIGIADHLPLLYVDDRALAMGEGDLEGYVEQVLAARDKYMGDIAVKLGIEADHHSPTNERRAQMLAAYPFDFVIGSVHILNDWIVDDPRYRDRYEEIDVDRLYLDYIQASRDLVATGLFDIVGHADLPKKFGHRPSVDLVPFYRQLLKEVGGSGMAYEVNTAGLRWPAGEMYPEPGFVHAAAELGVPVTLGSDAHRPEDIGRDFDRALALVKEAGYETSARFNDRVMTLEPLP